MLTGLVQNLRLRAEARTGLSSAVVVFALIAAIAVAVAFVFFVFAAFIWLAERYSPLTAALIVAGLVRADRHPVRARSPCCRSAAPASAPNARWRCAASRRCSTPRRSASRLQLGRTIGLRRIAPLAAAGFLAAALAKEWFRDRPDDGESAERSRKARRRRRKRAGGFRQRGARDAAVVVHAPHQVVDAVEFHLGPDPFDESDIDRLPVEIGGKIEQEYFEQHRADVEHRAAAETCHAVMVATADIDAHGIDPVPQSAGRIEPQIGGRIAELAPALVAVHHLAGYEPGEAEHLGGIGDVPLGRARHGSGRRRCGGRCPRTAGRRRRRSRVARPPRRENRASRSGWRRNENRNRS